MKNFLGKYQYTLTETAEGNEAHLYNCVFTSFTYLQEILDFTLTTRWVIYKYGSPQFSSSLSNNGPESMLTNNIFENYIVTSSCVRNRFHLFLFEERLSKTDPEVSESPIGEELQTDREYLSTTEWVLERYF